MSDRTPVPIMLRPSSSPQSLHILLIEDNDEDAELFSEMLNDATDTYQVERAVDLAEAVDRIQRVPPDAILLDLHLPDCGGIECLQGLKQQVGQVPIIVLTGLDNQRLAVSCLETGAQDFLSKVDVEVDHLRRSIGYALARNQVALAQKRAHHMALQLTAVMEASSDAIIVCDPEGCIQSWNRGAHSIFGYEPEETFGRSIDAVVVAPISKQLNELDTSPTERQESNNLLSPFGEAAEQRPLEVTSLHKNGKLIYVSVIRCRIQQLTSATMQHEGCVYVFRDITESKRKRVELTQQNRRLLLRDEYMRALTARLHAAREEEQKRMSREVHDSLGQLLTGVKMDLRWLGRRLKSPTGVDRELLLNRLDEAESLVEQTISAMQQFALELRPSALDTLGLGPAIRGEGRRFEARSGIVTQVSLDDSAPIDDDIATQFFRILQELLNNVARHANADRVDIQFIASTQIYKLVVEDNGIGIGKGTFQPDKSLGILGIHERTTSLGGEFRIGPRNLGGTRATVEVLRRPSPLSTPPKPFPSVDKPSE